jgi:hypothetical protein
MYTSAVDKHTFHHQHATTRKTTLAYLGTQCWKVDKFFETLARLESSDTFSLAKSENNAGSGEEESVRKD